MPYQFAIKEVAGITKIKTIVSIFHKTKKRSLFLSIKNLLVCFKPFTFGILKTKALFLEKSQSALYSTK
ncbi:hypothetical protein ACIXWW_06665 [Bacteroides fragilis]